MIPQYSVMLAPNEQVDFADSRVKYPGYVSTKLDGMRAIMYNGTIYSRNLKPVTNTLQHYFAGLRGYSKSQGHVLDGELYCKSENFGKTMSALTKEGAVIPDDLRFHVFDLVKDSEWGSSKEPFMMRVYEYTKHYVNSPELKACAVEQTIAGNPKELQAHFRSAIEDGEEGLIFKAMDGLYKHGRATLNQGTMFKFKEWVTDDATIVGFEQGTKMKAAYKNSERGKDELGRTARSHCQDTRELIEEIGCINLRLKDGTLCSAGLAKGVDIGLTWNNRDLFVGKWVEVNSVKHGMKDKPRFTRILRLRPDLD